MRRAAQLSGALRTARRVLINRQDEARVRALVRSVARAPVGDDVLPSLLCADVRRTYAELQPAGRPKGSGVLEVTFDDLLKAIGEVRPTGDAATRAELARSGRGLVSRASTGWRGWRRRRRLVRATDRAMEGMVSSQ